MLVMLNRFCNFEGEKMEQGIFHYIVNMPNKL